MSDIISNLFRIQSRYLRSAHLERDFSDPKALKGYVLTPQVRHSLERLASGMSPHSGQRAWRITGDYGAGKSSLALVLAHLFTGSNTGLPVHLRDVVNFKEVGVLRPRLLPVLVTGSREPLAVALLRSLRRSLLESYKRGRRPAVIDEIQEQLETESGKGISDEIVIDLLTKAGDYISASGRGTGLLIILDELGKLLEYASLNPERQDVFLLQTMAEHASRSGKSPLFVVGLLHQGFNAYADHLSESAQKEWEKVAGRFEELVFSQPLEQTSILVADALNVRTDQLPDSIITQCKQDMVAALELGWYGPAFARKSMVEDAPRLYPIHPTVLPVLVKLFSRFGQNERSLFSFLLSNEPFSLHDFAKNPIAKGRFYRLHNLYDYARSAFGHRLGLSYRSHWNQIDSMIASFTGGDEHDLHILKTVGILNLLDSNNMLAANDSILLAMSGDNESDGASIEEALRRLQKGKRVLYYRGSAGGYCLWPHTSVNLDKAYEDATRAIGLTPHKISPLITAYLETRPLVARRHYIETGNLRHFSVRFSPVSDLGANIKFGYESADGLILVALCDTEEERRAALDFAHSEHLRDHKNILLAIPKPLNALTQLVQEYRKWEWIVANTPELNNDKYAAEEVSRQVLAARRMMEKRIHDFIGLHQFTGRTELQWFQQNELQDIGSGRELLELLSDICDKVYSKAPRVLNELINRRSLSSAAAGARTRLVERLFSSSSKPFLGMNPDKKPPEMSIYLSVLKEGRVHQESNATYSLVEPSAKDDPCNLLPSLNFIRCFLERRMDSRVKVSELIAELRCPPYGVRDGLSPLLLAVFAVVNDQHVAFYYNGAFMQEMAGLDIMHLLKVPDAFEIQYCKIAGVRSDIYEKLLKVLDLRVSKSEKVDVLDVVRPLCIFAAKLPKYTIKTRALSPQAIAVRSALLNAKEPATLLFHDLPQICGFEPFTVDRVTKAKEVHKFVHVLKNALDELRLAYPKLQDRIKDTLTNAFDATGRFTDIHAGLAHRAENILIAVTEPRLKSFCMRLIDRNLSESEWLESLGSLVCSMPPAKWTDAEVNKYEQELDLLCGRFRRVETIAFKNGKSAHDGSAVRVAITQIDGSEVDNVIYVSQEEETKVEEIEAEIMSLLERTKRVGLAAAARAFWNILSQQEGASGSQAEGGHPESLRG